MSGSPTSYTELLPVGLSGSVPGNSPRKPLIQVSYNEHVMNLIVKYGETIE